MATLNVNFTELEITVLEVIKNGDELDSMPCECFENIADNSGVSKKVLRGVLSSLIQKNAITEGEYPNGMKAFYYNL